MRRRDLVFPGDPGAPKGSNFPDKNNFAPRVGFAWDVFGNAKTSLRGGWGMFYDILKGEDNLQYNGQAPFFGFEDIFFNPSNGQAPINYSQPFVATGTVNTFPRSRRLQTSTSVPPDSYPSVAVACSSSIHTSKRRTSTNTT